MLRASARARAVVAFTLIATLGIVLVTGSPATAHETRKVGPYTFVVGFGTEPAFGDVPNSVQIRVSKGEGKKEEPVVEGVDLEVEVMHGDEATSLEVEPRFVVGVFGEPGDYRANFVPTRPGQYTFHFTGAVEDMSVDETFTSGPETFSDVNDPAELAFPFADPSNAQLAERIQQDTARLESAASEAEDDASTANVLAIVALIVGGLGLVAGATVGGLALSRTRKA